MDWNQQHTQELIAGSEAAFEHLYHEFSPYLYTCIYKICRDREQAKDLLHDTFVQAHKRVAHLNEKDALVFAWLKRIAINLTINFINKQQRLSYVEPEHIEQQEVEVDLESITINEASFNYLLASLDVKDRAIVWLYIVEQYKHKEIAELTGYTLSFSKSVISRAMKKLRQRSQLLEVING